jgi:hypothetical protein
MAIADLLERAKTSLSSDEYRDTDDDTPYEIEIPDDASELDGLAPDPKPRRTSGTKKATARTHGRVTVAQRRQIEDNLNLLAGLIGLGVGFRDEICADALSDHQEKMIQKIIPIISRNPSVLEWLIGKDAKFLDWIAFGSACAPFGKTVWQHHVTKSIGHDHDETTTHEHYDYPAPTLN